MTENIRPVRRQHTVTERLLKGFAGSDGRVAVFDKAYGQRRLHSPGAGIFVTVFDSWDSRGAEERWNLFELHLPAALTQLAAGDALSDPNTIETLRDIVALHWLRSRSIVEARKQATARFLEQYRRSAPDIRAAELAEALRQRTGLIAASRSALEWTVDQLIKEVEDGDLSRWHSQHNIEYYEVARQRLEQLPLGIHRATTSDLVIGDAPVITTIRGRAGSGPHQNVGIEKTDRVVMPVRPDTLLSFGDTDLPETLTSEDVVRCNDLQWSTFEVWIAAQPGGSGDQRLTSEARAAHGPLEPDGD